MPRRSGWVVHKSDRYMSLEKSYDRIPNELNAEPIKYNESLQDKDVELWKKGYESLCTLIKSGIL